MEIYIRGLASGYEPEHVARLFFQPALLAKRWPARGADAVAVLRGKKPFCMRRAHERPVRCAHCAAGAGHAAGAGGI